MFDFVNPEYLENLARRVLAGDDLSEADRLALADAVDQVDRLSFKAAIALRDELIWAFCEKWHPKRHGRSRARAFLDDALPYLRRWNSREAHRATNPHSIEMRIHDLWDIFASAPVGHIPTTVGALDKILKTQEKKATANRRLLKFVE